jgi:hypothetical protein
MIILTDCTVVLNNQIKWVVQIRKVLLEEKKVIRQQDHFQGFI